MSLTLVNRWWCCGKSSFSNSEVINVLCKLYLQRLVCKFEETLYGDVESTKKRVCTCMCGGGGSGGGGGGGGVCVCVCVCKYMGGF